MHWHRQEEGHHTEGRRIGVRIAGGGRVQPGGVHCWDRTRARQLFLYNHNFRHIPQCVVIRKIKTFRRFSAKKN